MLIIFSIIKLENKNINHIYLLEIKIFSVQTTRTIEILQKNLLSHIAFSIIRTDPSLAQPLVAFYLYYFCPSFLCFFFFCSSLYALTAFRLKIYMRLVYVHSICVKQILKPRHGKSSWNDFWGELWIWNISLSLLWFLSYCCVRPEVILLLTGCYYSN